MEDTTTNLERISSAAGKAERVYTAGKTIKSFLGKKKSPGWALQCNELTQKELLKIISLAKNVFSQQDQTGNETFLVEQGWCVNLKRGRYVNLTPQRPKNQDLLCFTETFSKYGLATETYNVGATGAVESISRIILLVTQELISIMQQSDTRTQELLNNISSKICGAIEVQTKGSSIIQEQYSRSWREKKRELLEKLNEFMFEYHQMINDLLLISERPTLNPFIVIVKSLEKISDILNLSYQATSHHHIKEAEKSSISQKATLQRNLSFSRGFKVDNSYKDVFGDEHADKAIEILTLHGIRRHLAALFEEYANSSDDLEYLENRIVRLLFTKYICLNSQDEMIPNQITRASIFAQVLAILTGCINSTNTEGNQKLRAILKHGLASLSKLLNAAVPRKTAAVSPAGKSSKGKGDSISDEAKKQQENKQKQNRESENRIRDSAELATRTQAYFDTTKDPATKSTKEDQEKEPTGSVLNKLLDAGQFLRRNPLDLYDRSEMQKSYVDLCFFLTKVAEIVQGCKIPTSDIKQFIVENIALMSSLKVLLKHLIKHRKEKITGVSIADKEDKIYKAIDELIKLIEDSTKPDQQEQKQRQERKEEEEEETTSNTEQNTSRPTSSSAAESSTFKAPPSNTKEKTEIQKTNEANYATTIKYFTALSVGIEQVQFNSRNDKAFTVFIIIESITTSLNQFIKHDAGDNETEHKLRVREAITQELRDAGLLKGNGRFFSPKETHKLIALNRSYVAHITQTRQ